LLQASQVLGSKILQISFTFRGLSDLHGPSTQTSTSPEDFEPANPAGREAQANKALGRSWRQFTHAELSEATGGFSKEALLGEGAFGQVYLATLPDGTRLAVKQLKDGGMVSNVAQVSNV
jgi:hypothetical protein